MSTTNLTSSDVFSRPAARFVADGLDIRASALGRCRRALWYTATEQPVTNPPEPESLTLLEAGNALEPVVVRAMRRAGWQVSAADRDEPQSVTVEAVARVDRDRSSRRHRLSAALQGRSSGGR